MRFGYIRKDLKSNLLCLFDFGIEIKLEYNSYNYDDRYERTGFRDLKKIRILKL